MDSRLDGFVNFAFALKGCLERKTFIFSFIWDGEDKNQYFYQFLKTSFSIYARHLSATPIPALKVIIEIMNMDKKWTHYL
jgi:hypothetical protein